MNRDLSGRTPRVFRTIFARISRRSPSVRERNSADYIHVVDLAKGHVLAVNKLAENPGLLIVNLGTGHGYSVLDMVKAFEKVTGKPIPYKIMPRRPGDIDECYADPSYAEKILGFKAQKSLEDMCRDAMRWQTMNPDGYGD